MAGVEVDVYHPLQFEREELIDLQEVAHRAYVPILGEVKADALVDWFDPGRFIASHFNPNSEVGKRYNSNQSYTHPAVAVATIGRQLVGFGYSAHNVSVLSQSTHLAELEKLTKKLSIVRNYCWFRGAFVLPEYQRQGICTQIGCTILRKAAIPFQPVSSYTLDGISPAFVPAKLEQLGFAQTGEQEVQIFGEDSDPVKQLRWQAPSARSVLRQLAA